MEAAKIVEAATDARRRAERKAAAEHRKRKHKEMVGEVSAKIKARFPAIPAAEAEVIAVHAFEVGSRRVGRTSSLTLDEKIDFAVTAHIRHCHTDYDDILWNPGGSLFGDSELKRWARDQVRPQIEKVLRKWRGEASTDSTLADVPLVCNS